MRLVSLATASGVAIKSMHNPHAATARFLIALAAELQSAPRPEPAAHAPTAKAARPPALISDDRRGRVAGAPVAKARR
jgi:hypothetical protein